MTNAYEERQRLTFEQAEGLEPLPSQLRPKEISQELRSRLFEVLYKSIIGNPLDPVPYLRQPWRDIAYEKWVHQDHRPADEARRAPDTWISDIKKIMFFGDYVIVFGTIQFILRTDKAPENLSKEIDDALRISRSAYRVFDSDTIVPIGLEAEGETLKRAFADLAASEFHGARAHLRSAGSKLTEGDCPGSIRESIHAVEAVAVMLEPSASTLGPALARLEKSMRIHPALRSGFASLYGYTSDEDGIRHALVDQPVAQVDETDALYMLGSCAAFVSYLINKARGAGLLKAAG